MLVEGTIVTCPALSCPPATAELLAEVRGAVRSTARRLGRDDGRAQFARFVFVGGLSSALYAVVFVLLSAPLGNLPANTMGAVLSTMLANELHRRTTFHAGERISWLEAQWEGGALAAVGILATTSALSWLDAAVGSGDVVLQLVLIATVTGAIGLLRFVALRWVFRPRLPRSA